MPRTSPRIRRSYSLVLLAALVLGLFWVGEVCSDNLEEAERLAEEGRWRDAVSLLAEAPRSDSEAWKYDQAIGHYYYRDAKRTASVTDPESNPGEVFGESAEQALRYLTKAAKAAPEEALQAHRNLLSLLEDRQDVRGRAEALELARAGLSRGDASFTRIWRKHQRDLATAKWAGILYAVHGLLTLIILTVAARKRLWSTGGHSIHSTGTVQRIVLESPLEQSLWGLCLLACGWVILWATGPSSLVTAVYGQDLGTRGLEAFFFLSAYLFTASSLLFFGSTEIVLDQDDRVVLRKTSLVQDQPDWAVARGDLLGVDLDVTTQVASLPQATAHVTCHEVTLRTRDEELPVRAYSRFGGAHEAP